MRALFREIRRENHRPSSLRHRAICPLTCFGPGIPTRSRAASARRRSKTSAQSSPSLGCTRRTFSNGRQFSGTPADSSRAARDGRAADARIGKTDTIPRGARRGNFKNDPARPGDKKLRSRIFQRGPSPMPTKRTVMSSPISTKRTL